MGIPYLNTIDEAAAKLKCSPSNCYALVASGDLACYRVGAGNGGIRISDEQIEAFLRQRAAGGGREKELPAAERVPSDFKVLDGERLKEKWAKR